MRRKKINVLASFLTLCFVFFLIMDGVLDNIFPFLLDKPLMALLFVYLITVIGRQRPPRGF